MAEPLIVITKSRVKQGKIEDVARFYRRIEGIVDSKEPRVVAFHAFLNEDGTEMASIQVHPDTASMELHMQVLRDNWDESFSDYTEMIELIGVEYFGTPSDSALAMDRESGIPVSVSTRHIAGFTRVGRI